MFGELSQAFGKTFLVAGFVPACALVACNARLLNAGILNRSWFAAWKVPGIEPVWMFGIAALVIGMALYFGSSWIYKLIEGYRRRQCFGVGIALLLAAAFGEWVMPMREGVATVLSVCGAIALAFWALHYAFTAHNVRRLTAEIVRVKNLYADGTERSDAERELRVRFPTDPKLVLPTALGNILRACEQHPQVLYNIAPISGWTRIASQIPERYAAQIDDAKLNVTFRLSLMAALSVLGVELAIIAKYVPGHGQLGWLVPLLFATVYALYRSSLQPALKWGEYLRAAFDLYRFDVLKQLHVEVPKTAMSLEQERQLWARVQEATHYVNTAAKVQFVAGGAKPSPDDK